MRLISTMEPDTPGRSGLLFLLCLFLFLPLAAWGQAPLGDWDELMQQLAEELVDEADEQQWEAQQEYLAELHENPIDLNSATREQLLALPFMDKAAADGLLDYMALNGPMRSLGELRFIRDLSLQQQELLRFFVTLSPVTAAAAGRDTSWWGRARHDLLMRVDVPLYERDGWSWGRGVANRWSYTWQQGRHLDAGLRAETDAGEPMFSRDIPLWDSYGGHVQLKDVGPVQTLLLGDYKAGFGEGLVLNNGLRFGKLSMGLWRTQGGIRPHRSADEVNYLRGVATTLALGSAWQLTALYSYRHLDATVAADNSVQTINTSGLHRTAGELNRRGSLGSQVTALHAAWQQAAWRAGATALYQYYDHQFHQGTQLYRQYYPDGYQFGAAGVDYGYRSSALYVGGETARSLARADADGRRGGWSTLNKAVWRFSANTQLAAIQRFYSKHYFSPYASAYGENSRVQNESGLALQFDADRLGPVALRALFDYFYSPWPRYTMTRYSTGWEGLLQTTYTPRLGRSLLLRYSLKSKEQSDRRHYSHRLRATYAHTFSAHWTAQASAFYHLYHEPEAPAFAASASHSTGVAVAPRLDYTNRDGRLRLSLLAALFRTDDFDSRLFLYEPSLFQTFGLQQLYGHGQRLAATLRLRTLSRRWSLQTKFGLTHYTDRAEISNGPLRIASPWKADFQLLLRMQLR